jgi:hypothetical protein
MAVYGTGSPETESTTSTSTFRAADMGSMLVAMIAIQSSMLNFAFSKCNY